MALRSPSVEGLTLLSGSPDAPALVVGSTNVSYAELGERVEERAAQLGTERRLVMVSAGNAIEPIVTYLAALAGGHPVMLLEDGVRDSAADERRGSFVDRFDPDVLLLGGEDDWQLDERRPGTRHDLHPDLAMLASTSGSTGSPKLVRLSQENLRANADAIADYLRLTPDDRAITTLPSHYCYGLSVLNSHFSAGASLVLSDRSVVEDEFWDEFVATRATSFAGVPYTFDLLDSSGFTARNVPDLRYITQAGGRLSPDRVHHYARLGEERGFDFVVMYGQTEATARMAYLPPDLAHSAASSIGIPIPGGRFRIDAAPGEEAGELIYSGPNVMMGYAETPEEFSEGRVIEELRTGDLARMRDDGLYEIVGRASRFAKVFGLRIDLDRVEWLLGQAGFGVRAASSDERLLLFVRSEREAGIIASRAGEMLGLPAHVTRTIVISEFPRTSSGKNDYASLLRYAEELDGGGNRGAVAPGTAEAIRSLYSELLCRADIGLDDSFTSLDGDSLSFVEVALRLDKQLGQLPQKWPSMTIRELADTRRDSAPKRRWLTRVETPAMLRSVAIFIIVASHANLLTLQGGAHLLLAVAGYNLARFQLAATTRTARVRALRRSMLQVVVPAVVWIGAVAMLSGQYDLTTVLLVNNFTGDPSWDHQWHFWFLETFAWSIAALAALFAIPAIDRLERRFPHGFALGVLTLTLAIRLWLAEGIQTGPTERYTAAFIVWIIALGWVIARSTTLTQRILASIAILLSVPGFMGEPLREGIIVAGMLVLLWVPTLPAPRQLVPAISALAGASMFIYLTHWQVYPPFENSVPWFATALSLAVGVLVWKTYTVIRAGVATLMRAATPYRWFGIFPRRL